MWLRLDLISHTKSGSHLSKTLYIYMCVHNECCRMPTRRDTTRNNLGGQQIVMNRETFLDMVREVAN